MTGANYKHVHPADELELTSKNFEDPAPHSQFDSNERQLDEFPITFVPNTNAGHGHEVTANCDETGNSEVTSPVDCGNNTRPN